MRGLALLGIAVFSILTGCAQSYSQNNGQFVGALDLRMLPNGRGAQLLNDFGYIDPAGKHWIAPKNTVVDGASIPRPLWSLIGSPWTGKYREASVIHDYYCVTKDESWESVHKTFYTAMLANHVDETQAKIMYAAVYRFGPRWKFEYIPDCKDCLALPYAVDFYSPKFNSEEFNSLKNDIATSNPSLEEIEKEADTSFIREVNDLRLGNPILIQ